MRNYVMWDIEEILKTHTEEPERAAGATEKLEALFIFPAVNNLLNSKVRNEEGQIAKRQITKSELTEEDCALASNLKNSAHRWLGSKASQKSPHDIKILKNSLL